jgi:hypothetical protein
MALDVASQAYEQQIIYIKLSDKRRGCLERGGLSYLKFYNLIKGPVDFFKKKFKSSDLVIPKLRIKDIEKGCPCRQPLHIISSIWLSRLSIYLFSIIPIPN